MPFKVIIAGGRDYHDYINFSKYCDKLLANKIEIEVISGGAQGADALAKRYAKSRQMSFKEMPAKWEIYGRKAGPVRNAEMAKEANALIAFWDGKSKGTKSMIDIAKKEGLKVRIYSY